MHKILNLCYALILFATPIGLPAQQVLGQPDGKLADAHYYQLSFSVQEVEENGKISNSRSYTTTIATTPGPGTWQSIRTGDKVPLKTGDKGNLEYMDVGVSIDCTRAQEVNGKLALQISADISSALKATDPTAPPIIRQNRWSSSVLIPIAKPTVIFSSDNLQDKGKLQVELIATHIN